MGENEESQLEPKPENHMALAIFSTVCCCLPLGILAIIKASKVNDLYFQKQYDAAKASADEAKKYSYIGIAIGAVSSVIYLIINGAALLSGALGQ